jgi:hypothetical protein
MTETGIARKAGLSRSSITRLRDRCHPTVRRDVATAIASVTPGEGPLVGMLSSLGTMRRLQGLAALGYSSRAVADRTGLQDVNLRRIRRGVLSHVTATTAALVRDAADHLELVENHHPDLRLVNLAARKGWANLLAWDNIDDPDEVPSMPRDPVKRAATDTAEEVERMLGTDSAQNVAARLGYADLDSLLTTLKRPQKPELSRIAERLATTRTEAA